ncbi:glycosyltransferase family 4 protein [Niabella terrae]
MTKHLQPDFETLLVVGEQESHEKDASPMADQMGINKVIIPEMGRAIHPLKDYSTYWKLKKVIKDFKPDIIHTHGAKPGAVGRFAAATSNVPVIVHTYHGHVFHSYFNKTKTRIYLNIERALGARTDALIAISPGQQKDLTNLFRIAKPGRFRMIPLGFDLAAFTSDQIAKRMKFRREFGIKDDEIAIGIVGRLVPIKNHNLFLEALAYTLEHTDRKVKAFIVGDGETRERLIRQAGELGISVNKPGQPFDTEKRLTFTSWRMDVDVVNAGIDIMCLSSKNEGTPVSLIEAQAAGKAVLSTRVGGIADIIIENETGLLSDIKDREGYFRNLTSLVNDDSLRQRLAANGNWVLDRYGVQRLASDFRALYYELLEKKEKNYVRPVFKEKSWQV